MLRPLPMRSWLGLVKVAAAGAELLPGHESLATAGPGAPKAPLPHVRAGDQDGPAAAFSAVWVGEQRDSVPVSSAAHCDGSGPAQCGGVLRDFHYPFRRQIDINHHGWSCNAVGSSEATKWCR